MTGIIIAFPKIENANSIKNILSRNGYPVICACNRGNQVLQEAQNSSDGIVICGYQLSDMHYQELRNYLPETFDMLLVSSRNQWDERMSSNVVSLLLPLKVHELLSTVEMMVSAQERRRKKRKAMPKKRSKEEQRLIDQAKAVLMNRNNMTESEAHKYIQKCSMDSGNSLPETAEMILSMLDR